MEATSVTSSPMVAYQVVAMEALAHKREAQAVAISGKAAASGQVSLMAGSARMQAQGFHIAAAMALRMAPPEQKAMIEALVAAWRPII